jgi:glucokinase
MTNGGTTHHLGIDLGGTNLKWAAVEQDGDAWRVLGRGQLVTDAEAGADAVIGRFIEIGRDALAQWPDLASVGIGVPGLYDPATGRARALINLPGGWPEVPIAGPVADALGLPAALINDARAFGLAELRLGAGRGAASMVGLTLGTGVGGVIAIDGRVHLGHDGTAGEIGHQTLDPDGPSCNCGNNGCLESFARADRLAAACGAETVEAAVLAARSGDDAARAGFERVGRYLGIGIANMVTVIAPDRVVIGGGVAAAGDLLLEPIRRELAARVRTTALTDVQVVTAELGIWAGAMGAAVHGAEAARDGMAQRPGVSA